MLSSPSKYNFKLFVYGTLKQGCSNHKRYCADVVHIEPASTWGRLYHLKQGYPALEIPKSHILHIGTANLVEDTITQAELILPQQQLFPDKSDDWDLIHGEILTFTNPLASIPAIDQLEDFNPLATSLYQRVLVLVDADNSPTPVWLYHYIQPHNGQRLLSGFWHENDY